MAYTKYCKVVSPDFFKNTNDLAQNNSKKSGDSKTVVFKKITSDFDDYYYNYQFNALAPSQKTSSLHTFLNLLSSPHISPEQPPDVQLG